MVKTVFLLLAITVSTCKAQENNLMFHRKQMIELEAIAQKHKIIGMSLCVIKNDHLFPFYCGLRNLKDSLPITEKTLFRVASISKTITAIAFMQLVEKGKINLDTDISKYLKKGITHNYFPDDSITSRMLLSHTSSIYDGEDYGKFLNRTYQSENIPHIYELLVEESKIWTNKKPGTYFTYSNLNYGILATIIENVSEQRFDKYVLEKILKPLNIDGGYNLAKIGKKHQISVLYRGIEPQADYYENNFPIDKEYPIGINGFYYSPQGGLRIAVTDLTKILQLLMNQGIYKGRGILNPETIDEMEKNHWRSNGSNGDTYHDLFLNWGLGLHKTTGSIGGDYIMPKYSFIGHRGDAYGLISEMYYCKEKNIGFVFISNGTKSPKGYSPGKNSHYFELEEDIFNFIHQEFMNK